MSDQGDQSGDTSDFNSTEWCGLSWTPLISLEPVTGEFVIKPLQEAGRVRRSVLRTDHGWLWPFIRSWQVWVGKNPPFRLLCLPKIGIA